MRRESTIVLVALGAVAVAGLALLWVDGGRSGGLTRAAAAHVADAGSRSPARLATPDSAGAAAVDADAVTEVRRAEVAPELLGAVEPEVDSEGFDRTAAYGVVVDEAGLPIADADVVLLESSAARAANGERVLDPIAASKTDRAGRFRFKGHRALTGYRVALVGDGYLPRVVRLATGALEQIVLEAALPLTGQVKTAGGVPIAGVDVIYQRQHWDGAAVQREFVSVSAADGGFELPWVGLETQLSLTAARPNGLPTTPSFQVLADVRSGYDIVLASGAPADVVVVDQLTGLPVAKAVLRCSRRPLEALRPGEFRLEDAGALTDRISLDATAPGYTQSRVNVRLEDLTAARVFTIPLVPSCRLIGRVEDSDGKPIENAVVWVRDSKQPALPRGLAKGVRVSHADSGRRAVSGADGTFEAAQLVPSNTPLTASVSATGYESLRVSDIELRAGGDELERTFVLQRAAVLEGRVLTAGEGRPVSLRWSSSKRSGSLASNDDGEYRITEVPSGEVELGAFLGTPSRRAKVELTETVFVEPASVTRHDFSLELSLEKLAGRVVDHDGTALAALRVSVRGEGEGFSHLSYSERTDAEGAFELEVPADSGLTYRLSGGRDGSGFSERGVVPGTTDLLFELDERAPLKLRVLSEITGEPITRFTAEWRPSGERSFRSQQRLRGVAPGADGGFVARLPPGILDLRVTDPAGQHAPALVFSVRLDSRGATQMVTLAAGSELVLRFKPKDGKQQRPPGNLLLLPEELDPDARPLPSHLWRDRRVTPSNRGRAQLRGLGVGRYHLVQAGKQLKFEPARIEVLEPGVTRVDVKWSRIENP